MNCPFHLLIYRVAPAQLPRPADALFEFGAVYRYERSGVVHGLTRVRGHDPGRRAPAVPARPDGRRAHDATLAVRPRHASRVRAPGLLPRAVHAARGQGRRAPTRSGREAEDAPSSRRRLAAGLELVDDPGGGAFYGPKISVQARDAIGRTHQLSTIQLDFQLPQRFDATYVGADNQRHRPIMIHRALFGSVERFLAILLEHYAGALPTWLMPEQFRVLPVRDDHADYADEVAASARAPRAARRRPIDADEPLGARIRQRQAREAPVRARRRRRRRRERARSG